MEIRLVFSGPQVLNGLVKRWLQELKDDKEVQAHFIFKTSLMNNLNHISCHLHASFYPVVDEFNNCQTCICHGIPMDHSSVNQARLSCPVTKKYIGGYAIKENSVRVGEQTILYMRSSHGRSKLKKRLSIDFDVIQRANIESLNGALMGAAYFVTPTSHHSDGSDNSELNCQVFQGIHGILTSFAEGLVCSSTCNIETATESSFRFYYFLLPLDKGLMLLRRLPASEEFLPVPAYSHLIYSPEIESGVKASLEKVEVSNYDPVQHEKGFHEKLNMLVEESLQFGEEEILPSDDDNAYETELVVDDFGAYTIKKLKNSRD